MMKTKSFALSLIASAVFACIGAAPAMAQNTNTPNVDLAQQQIRSRIQQGIASGYITEAEAQTLYQRERSIQFREMRIKRDGNATPQERRELSAEVEDMRAEVERKFSNRQTAGRQANTPGIDQSQQQIHARIEQGIQSGHITQREANRLFAREQRITRHEAQYKSDGRVTSTERQNLRAELASLSQDVEKMLRNKRRY